MKGIIIENVYIHFPSDVTGFFVPVKRICIAFNIDFPTEEKFILENQMLQGKSVYKSVDQGDGSSVDELCIPFMYALGWLGSATTHSFSRHLTYKKEALDFIYAYLSEPNSEKIIRDLNFTGRRSEFV